MSGREALCIAVMSTTRRPGFYPKPESNPTQKISPSFFSDAIENRENGEVGLGYVG